MPPGFFSHCLYLNGHGTICAVFLSFFLMKSFSYYPFLFHLILFFHFTNRDSLSILKSIFYFIYEIFISK
ncbi:hypothetical protein CLOM621_06958 [Clostridium sp. M62/1]|nr:hypothetical protein CLOM621_06958 [Clostridium sp. M62/1]